MRWSTALLWCRLRHDEGYTIPGVEKLRREQGIKRVVAAWEGVVRTLQNRRRRRVTVPRCWTGNGQGATGRAVEELRPRTTAFL